MLEALKQVKCTPPEPSQKAVEVKYWEHVQDVEIRRPKKWPDWMPTVDMVGYRLFFDGGY